MAKTILQKVVFKNTTVETLYNLYMDAKQHSAVIGAPVKIQNKEGAAFTAYDDYISGKNLQLIPGKLIVQSWWASDWNEKEIISTFILLFEQNGTDAIVNMTHANVPDEQYKSIKEGWDQYYWNPWKEYIKKLKAKK